MNRRSSFSFSRAFGVLVLVVAWFAMSNHCALALMSGASVSAAAQVQKNCCSSESKGADNQHDVPSRVCCKSIRALPTDAGAKVLKVPDAPLLAELVWAALVEISVDEGSAQLVAAATGPPEVRSFAEVVLQRSLLSHAPPIAL